MAYEMQKIVWCGWNLVLKVFEVVDYEFELEI